jgi:Xaa-Pro aminopeptidase
MFERDGLDFIRKAYKKHGLVNDHKKEFAIVAFGKNTKEVHYFPLKPLRSKGLGDHLKNGLAKGKGTKLVPNTLILLDIWARLDKKNAPYADMTWMFLYGKKVPADILQKWNILKKARDAAINYVQKHKLPRGLDIDRAAHDVIGNAGFGSSIKHTVGHSLGFDSPHGKLPGINWREYSPILKNVGYTIEPGMYFKDFGMRTEIDFYISNKNGVVITTPLQSEISAIYPR